MTRTSQTRWLEISVRTSGSATRAVAALLDRYGEGGSVTEVAIGPTAGTGLDASGALIKAFLPVNGAGRIRRRAVETALARIRRRHFHPPPAFRLLRASDWADGWKKDFKIVRVSSRLLIVPAWKNVTPENKPIVIRIDPGLAFGTGLHPTTRLCLKALEGVVRRGSRVLDVGTGSGILAIAARKLGAQRVIALDTDPEAVAAARRNFKLNGIQSGVSLRLGGLSRRRISRMDVIAVNILSRTIRTLAAELAGHLRPGGILIAAGLLEAQSGEVSAALRAAGLKMIGRRHRQGWVLLLATPRRDP